MITILFLTLLVSFSNASPPNNRVIGGSDANHGDFPFAVSLRSLSGSTIGNHFCGGGLISLKNVLTAAHCVVSRSASQVIVIAGTTERNGKGVPANVKNITVHKSYSNYYIFNDIAVLTLVTPFQETNLIKTIKLSRDNQDIPRKCTIIGWGRTSYPDGTLPDLLQVLASQTILNAECRQKLAHINVVQSNQICAQTIRGEGACHGDSGSPLVAETENGIEAIGIVSWGSPCANGYPDVFTRVSSFTDWIEENTE